MGETHFGDAWHTDEPADSFAPGPAERSPAVDEPPIDGVAFLAGLACGAPLGIGLLWALAVGAGDVLLWILLGAPLIGFAVAAFHRLAAAGGCATSLLWGAITAGLLTRVAPSEFGIPGVAPTILLAVASLLASAGYGLGRVTMTSERRSNVDSKGRRRFGLGLGGAAVVALGATSALLLAIPGPASFELTLSSGWHGGYHEWIEQPSYGDDFTATYKVDASPDHRLGTMPVVGVSVVRRDGSPSECLSAMDTWGRPAGPLYDGTIEADRDVALPAGRAYEEVRTFDGGRIYGFGLSRSRLTGVVSEPLCYVLAVTLPTGTSLSEADVYAIAQTFRYR